MWSSFLYFLLFFQGPATPFFFHFFRTSNESFCSSNEQVQEKKKLDNISLIWGSQEKPGGCLLTTTHFFCPDFYPSISSIFRKENLFSLFFFCFLPLAFQLLSSTGGVLSFFLENNNNLIFNHRCFFSTAPQYNLFENVPFLCQCTLYPAFKILLFLLCISS